MMQRNRPAGAVDGCWTAASEDTAAKSIAEPRKFGSAPDSACNKLYPAFSFSRQAAGGSARWEHAEVPD
jgi:hypothetical protein